MHIMRQHLISLPLLLPTLKIQIPRKPWADLFNHVLKEICKTFQASQSVQICNYPLSLLEPSQDHLKIRVEFSEQEELEKHINSVWLVRFPNPLYEVSWRIWLVFGLLIGDGRWKDRMEIVKNHLKFLYRWKRGRGEQRPRWKSLISWQLSGFHFLIGH